MLEKGRDRVHQEPFEGGMDRYLSPTDVWAIAFGCIIGWGAFVMPGTTFLPVAGPGGTMIAMAASAAIMLVIGHNYAYLMNRHPGTGGVYSYTKEAFGRDHAFLCSWFLSLSYISIVFLNATALFVVSRTLLGSLLQVGVHYQVAGYDVYLTEVALSATALVVIGFLLINEKPLVQRLQTVLAV
ncbi:MAG: APC family permease, partial [Atopobiaceae bacterium]|nr:APC family permease [Atopobiaceae bacterium]